MKFKKTILMVLAMVMLLSTSVFVTAADKEVTRTPGERVEIDFSLGGRNVNVLHLETGKLESYDENGVKVTTFLTEEEVAVKVAEAEFSTMDYDTGWINMYVPRNITGNEGAYVGSFDVPAPHTYVNLLIGTLPQTTMPTINVAFTNAWGDDTGWLPNIPQNSIVYMRASYPNEPYAARVSTSEMNSATVSLRSYSSY